MSLFRYAKKGWYGYLSGFGMFLGHYMAWISAGFMGAAAAAIVSTSITDITPGTVALQALGYTGLAVVVVGGWTTANANLYRGGLAGQGVFTGLSRRRVTLILGVLVVAASLFPFIYRGYLNLVTYIGIIVVPIGGILIAEHFILPRLGMTKFWARYKGVRNIPAMLAWAIALAVVGTAVALGLFPVYFGFLPSFAISLVLYVLFAKMMGAADEYPEGKANDELFRERVEVRHEKEAANAPDVDTKDYRKLSRVLRVIWIVDLAVIFAVALFVLLASPDVSTYEANQNLFFWVVGVGTVIYFVTTYWELRRNKAFASQALSDSAAEDSQEGQAESSATVS
jgi:MFS family permease